MKNSRLISILLAAVFLCNISYAQLPSYLPTNGLVAWYPFNGNANDESGNGHNGVVNGATLCADQNAIASSAYDFSGADSYIEIASSPIQSQGSLIAWVFPRSAAAVNNNWGYSASLIDQNIDAQNNSGVALYYHNSIHGVYAQVGWSGNNNNFINANPIQPLSLAEWQQVVFTFVQNSCSLYLNGELIATRTDMNAPSMSTANLYFGRAPWGGNQFNGQLDDIAIYNRALTPAEVTALFTATATNTGGGTTSTTAAPPGIPYQAEVRNDSGEVLANANVNVRFTLHELSANGTVSYQETHAITTNELGLFAATIGAGTAMQGTFADINWSQTTKFLQVEVDAGNGYVTMGNQQLMSVPYALYAANGPAGPQGPVGPQGPAGAEGQPGSNGLSAYEVWLDQGNIGTEDDFINSISPNHPNAYGFRNRFMFNAPSCGDASNNIIVLDSIQSSHGGFFYELTIKISQVGWRVFNTNFYIQNEQGLNIPCTFNMPLTPDNYQLSFSNFDSAVGGDVYATNRLLTLYIMVPQMEEENLKLMFSFNYDDSGDPCGASGGIDIQTILHH